jgi:outer membrane protein assembly factor BamB
VITVRYPSLSRIVSALLSASALFAAEWPRFRGPNGTGVADARNLPDEVGPKKNVAWKSTLPPGFSSPVLSATAVFVTAYEDQKLYTISIDRKTGAEKWRTEAPVTLPAKPKGPNSPVSPSPVTDGTNAYVFFDNFGLVSYGPDGKERWRHPLGPFNFPYGAGSSPMIAGRNLIMLCDQDTNSFLLALDKDTGKQRWKTDRSQATHGFSTPVLYTPERGPSELIVSGAYELTGYSADTGKRLWWVTGMAWQAKSIPVVAGDTVYVHSWMASLSELGHKEVTTPWEKILEERDANKDGKLSKEESPDESLVKIWFLYDLDKDGTLGRKDWEYLLARSSAKNGLYAIRLGGRGDVTATHVRWRYEKGLPNIPSPLLYRDALYVLREGGILTTLNPSDGSVVKQARIEGAIDAYFASPVAADGKIITASKDGKVAFIRAGREWELISVNDFEEEIWATPALADNQIFIRTQRALYCFTKQA